MLTTMTESSDEVRFVSGNERLARILADPDRRARVDAITAEIDLIDHGEYLITTFYLSVQAGNRTEGTMKRTLL